MSDWWDDPAFGSSKGDDHWWNDPAFGKSVDYIATQGVRGVADVPGMVADQVVESAKELANAPSRVREIYRGLTGQLSTNDIEAAKSRSTQALGPGPVSGRVQKMLNPVLGEEGPPPNEVSRYAGAVARGVGGALTSGGVPAILPNIGANVGSTIAAEEFPDNPIAPIVGGIVGGAAGGAPHLARGAKHSSFIRAGYEHPDFPQLASAMFRREGGGTVANPKVNPESGARGPAQVMPATAGDPGYGVPKSNGTPADDVRMGKDYLAAMLGKYGGDSEKALAAYNWGPGNLDKAVKKYGDDWYYHAPKETQDYVAKSMIEVYGGPRAASAEGVPPIDPREMADIMGDPEAAGLDPDFEEWSRQNKEEHRGYSEEEIAAAQEQDLLGRTDPYGDNVHDLPVDKLDELTPDELRDFQETGAPSADVLSMEEVQSRRYQEQMAEANRRLDEQDRQYKANLQHNLDLLNENIEDANRGILHRSLGEVEEFRQQAEALLQRMNNSTLPALGHDIVKEIVDRAKALEELTGKVHGEEPITSVQPRDSYHERHTPYIEESPRPANDLEVERDQNPPAQMGQLPQMRNRKPPTKAPEGHDEEPSGKYVGNVNLDRLKTTKDMDEVIKDAASKIKPNDVQSHEATEELARHLGFENVEQMVNHNPTLGELPEYAVALRNHLVESSRQVVKFAKRLSNPLYVTDFDRANFAKAWVQHVALQEHASKVAGTAGRLLDSFNIIAKGGEDYRAALKELPKVLGDPEDMGRLADLIAEHADDPEAIAKITRDAMKPKAEDYIFSLRYNMMLSGLKTHVANILGNTTGLVKDLVDHGVASVIGSPRHWSENADRVMAKEVAARLYGLGAGMKLGVRNMPLSFKLGSPLDLSNRLEFRARTFKGKLGFLEAPTRALAAEDEFFRSTVQVMELYGQAARKAGKEGLSGKEFWDRVEELSHNPTPEMENIANDKARLLRYQDPPSWLGRVAETARMPKAGDSYLARSGRMLLRVALPFIRTPDSLFRFALRNSPLGIISPKNLADFKAGGARRDVALARVAVGTAITWQFAQWALDGNVTGAGPDDPRKKQELMAKGWQPYSFKVGDHYYSYERIQPLSTMIGAAATAVEQAKEEGHDDKSFTDKMVRVIMGVADAATNSTWTESVNELIKAKDQGSTSLANYLSSVAQSFTTPAIVRDVNQSYIDPVSRDTTGSGSFRDRILGRVETGIPGLSDNLPARHDVLGREVPRGQSLGPDILSPLNMTQEDQDTVTQEVESLSGHSKGALVTPAGKSITVGGERRSLNAKEFQDYQELSGKYFTAGMRDAMSDFNYGFASDDEKRKIVKKVLSTARKEAREELFGSSKKSDNWWDAF